jgi:hypothetical protein
VDALSTHPPQALARARPRLEIDFDIERTLDRLQNAKQSDYDQATLDSARLLLPSHQAKHCPRNPLDHPPDLQITAQILAVCGGAERGDRHGPGVDRVARSSPTHDGFSPSAKQARVCLT